MNHKRTAIRCFAASIVAVALSVGALGAPAEAAKGDNGNGGTTTYKFDTGWG